MTTIQTFVPADYTVWAIAASVFVVSVVDSLVVLVPVPGPWYRGKRGTLWHARSLMSLSLAFWGACQILRLNVLWGPHSVVAPASVTNWTSQGWLCRIYLTASLGVFAPLTAWLSFFMLALMLARVIEKHSNASQFDSYSRGIWFPSRMLPGKYPLFEWVVVLSLLTVFPIAAAQSVIAWISLTLTYNNNPVEESPRSLIGYFLAAFWYGSDEQCAVIPTVGTTLPNQPACTQCVFPAAAVIVHVIWTCLYVLGVFLVCWRLCSFSIDEKAKRRVRAFGIWMPLAAACGAGCIGASIAFEPFGWVNQGLWLGYVATMLVSAVIISMIGLDLPPRIQKDIDAEMMGTIFQGTIAPPAPPPVFPHVVDNGDVHIPASTYNPMEEVIVRDASEDEGYETPEEAYMTPSSSVGRSESAMTKYFSAGLPSPGMSPPSPYKD